MKNIIKITLLVLVIFNFFIIDVSYTATDGASELWITRADTGGHNAHVDDIIEFQVYIDTNGEKITGVAFFLTIDPSKLQPVLDEQGRPFNSEEFLGTSVAVFNSTHRDSLHLIDTANRIPGFQLDYYQSTGPASYSGQRPYAIGSGLVASFRLKIVGITELNTTTSINFDYDDTHGRLTTYYKLNQSGYEQRFHKTTGFWLTTTFKTESENKNSFTPREYSLAPNYPNPFNSATKINYQIPKVTFVRLSIYNILGKNIKILVNEKQGIGKYHSTWNGNDESGHEMPSGIYFYELKTNNFKSIFKMMLLR